MPDSLWGKDEWEVWRNFHYFSSSDLNGEVGSSAKLQARPPSGHNWEESEQNSENIFLTQGDKSSPDPWGNLIWLATSLEAGWREHQTGEITYFTKEFPVTISQTNTSQILHKYSSKKFFVALSQPNMYFTDTSQVHHKKIPRNFSSKMQILAQDTSSQAMEAGRCFAFLNFIKYDILEAIKQLGFWRSRCSDKF